MKKRTLFFQGLTSSSWWVLRVILGNWRGLPVLKRKCLPTTCLSLISWADLRSDPILILTVKLSHSFHWQQSSHVFTFIWVLSVYLKFPWTINFSCLLGTKAFRIFCYRPSQQNVSRIDRIYIIYIILDLRSDVHRSPIIYQRPYILHECPLLIHFICQNITRHIFVVVVVVFHLFLFCFVFNLDCNF